MIPWQSLRHTATSTIDSLGPVDLAPFQVLEQVVEYETAAALCPSKAIRALLQVVS